MLTVTWQDKLSVERRRGSGAGQKAALNQEGWRLPESPLQADAPAATAMTTRRIFILQWVLPKSREPCDSLASR